MDLKSNMKYGKIDSFSDEFRFLSNFYPCKVEYENLIYPSVEHAYQAAKTLDIYERRQILFSAKAGDAKKLGRKLTLRSDWESIKLQVMEDLVRQKFKYESLKKRLLATEDVYLEEGNYWSDFYWGVCNGIGENHLGKILMKVRKELRNAT